MEDSDVGRKLGGWCHLHQEKVFQEGAIHSTHTVRKSNTKRTQYSLDFSNMNTWWHQLELYGTWTPGCTRQGSQWDVRKWRLKMQTFQFWLWKKRLIQDKQRKRWGRGGFTFFLPSFLSFSFPPIRDVTTFEGCKEKTMENNLVERGPWENKGVRSRKQEEASFRLGTEGQEGERWGWRQRRGKETKWRINNWKNLLPNGLGPGKFSSKIQCKWKRLPEIRTGVLGKLRWQLVKVNGKFVRGEGWS